LHPYFNVIVMLMVGTIALATGLVVAQWGIRAMRDPGQPLHRDGRLRIRLGRAIMVAGAVVCLIGAVGRLV
jgi:hypothetical protein